MTKLKTRSKPRNKRYNTKRNNTKQKKNRRQQTRSKSQKKNRTRRQRGGCSIYSKFKNTIFSPALDVVSGSNDEDNICTKILEKIKDSSSTGANIDFINENDIIIYEDKNIIHICKLTPTDRLTGTAYKLYMYDCNNNKLDEGATTKEGLTNLSNIIIFNDDKEYEKIKINDSQTCVDFLNVVLEAPVNDSSLIDSDNEYISVKDSTSSNSGNFFVANGSSKSTRSEEI